MTDACDLDADNKAIDWTCKGYQRLPREEVVDGLDPDKTPWGPVVPCWIIFCFQLPKATPLTPYIEGSILLMDVERFYRKSNGFSDPLFHNVSLPAPSRSTTD
ncbi:unnamed protein product [Aspergillus oryzae]|nr:unnamed protein product [Aspergillus oryzae]GMF84024.1 unnamed protein product [Aspergillus oryzae]